jgi:biotin carboxyl carrier protein
MSDKSYTPPSGASYSVKRAADGSLLVKKSGEAKEQAVAVESRSAAIDAQTKRIHWTAGDSRGVFWVYASRGKRVISWPGGSMEIDAADLSEGAAGGAGALKPLKLTMPGKVLAVKVAEGELVEAGQGLVIVEAMKMENLLMAPGRAKVSKVHIQAGDRLESGATLISFTAAE